MSQYDWMGQQQQQPYPPSATPQPVQPVQAPIAPKQSTSAMGTILSKAVESMGGAQAFASNPALRQQLLTRLGSDSRFTGASIFGTHGDKMRFGDGTVIDWIKDVDGRNPTTAWHVEAMGSKFGQAGGPGGYTGHLTAPRASSGSKGSNVANGSSSSLSFSSSGEKENEQRSDKLWQMLMGRAQQGTNIDRTAPQFRQQVDPFVAQQDRARRQYESEQAERLSAQGMGDSGAMAVERRMGAERAGNASGMFESELVGRELSSRRQEISDALQQMGGMLSTEQQIALRQQLSQIDSALAREGMSIQRRGQDLAQQQFTQNLGQRSREFDLGQSLNWAQFNWMQDPNNPAYY